MWKSTRNITISGMAIHSLRVRPWFVIMPKTDTNLYPRIPGEFKPTLTLTLGLRYSLFSPPWETNGLEVTPTESLGTWFNGRGAGMNNGVPSIDFLLSPLIGPVRRTVTTGYYGWDYKDLGPRVALAWAPSYDSGLLPSRSVERDRAVYVPGSASCMTASVKACSIPSIRTVHSACPRVFPTRLRRNGSVLAPRHEYERHPHGRQLWGARIVPAPPRIILSLFPATRHLAAKPSPGVWTVASRHPIPTLSTWPFRGNSQRIYH